MNCKKCGNEIKEGNEFCTNCGYSINGIKKNKLKEYKIPIMIICIFVIIIILIFGIKAIFNKRDSSNYINNEVNTDTNIVTGEENQSEEKVYITQDSDVSPTGKEFIGEFSNSLTEIYQDYKSGNASMIKKYYSTSISNMKQFSIENSSNNEKIVETVYYYNTLNNKIIGSRYIINDINIYEKILAYNNSTLEEFLNTSIKGSFNIFLNAHNDNSSQEFKERFENYNKYINDNFAKLENKNFDDDNYSFMYNVLGDTLCINTNYKNNSNKIEVLLIAYDENTNPEEIIKKWYSNVIALNENQKIDQEIIEETNDDKFSSNKNEITNNSSTDNSKGMYFSGVLYYTEEDAINRLKKLNLTYEIEYGEDLSYSDKTVYKTGKKDIQGNIQYASSMWIEPGETVILYVNKYKDRTAEFCVDVASLIAVYVGKCDEDGISVKTDNFVFKLKINNKDFYSESISNSKAKEIMQTDKEIEDIIKWHGSDFFGNDYTKLKAKEYTGYGVFNLKLMINDVLILDNDCDIYETSISKNTEIDDSLGKLTNWEYKYEGSERIGLIFYICGSLGFGGAG